MGGVLGVEGETFHCEVPPRHSEVKAVIMLRAMDHTRSFLLVKRE